MGEDAEKLEPSYVLGEIKRCSLFGKQSASRSGHGLGLLTSSVPNSEVGQTQRKGVSPQSRRPADRLGFSLLFGVTAECHFLFSTVSCFGGTFGHPLVQRENGHGFLGARSPPVVPRASPA